jgi:Kef-type K+ transport system membrane component KefB
VAADGLPYPWGMDSHASHFVFADALILLSAAVLAVALFKRLKLSAVLGYLAAGMVVGPAMALATSRMAKT